MHRVVPLVFLIVIAACGGSPERADPKPDPEPVATTTAPPPPQRTEVSLRPLLSGVVLGRSKRLTGIVDDPEAQVSLYADAYPFDRARFVRRLRPTAGGRFATRVRPRRPTRYRAVVAGDAPGRSSFAQVAVGLRHRMSIVQTGPTSGRATITWKAPGVRLQRRSGGRVCLYQRPAGRKRWQREKCGKAKRSGSRLVATLAFTDPSPERGDRFVACTPSPVAKAYVSAKPRGCGRRTIAKLRAGSS